MEKKKFIFAMMLLLGMLFCIGCANKSTNTASKSTTDSTKATSEAKKAEATAEPVPTVSLADLPKPATKYVTDEMYKNAMLSEGNLGRLAAVMRKAAKGEEITVGVIGGSITAGCTTTTPDKAYANQFNEWWVKAFPKAKINFVNAGIGATTSYLGVHRVQKDLLDKKPDVVVVEFAVNDSDTLFFKETYEDLVRRILKAENNPAVILLFLTPESGYCAQTSELLVGFKYDLPRISYKNMVIKEMTKGTLQWKDLTGDGTHPNDKGHGMIGEILYRYLNNVYAKLNTITDKVEPLNTKPFFCERYIDGSIIDSTGIKPTSLGSFSKASINSQFPNDWTTNSGKKSIKFEIEAQNIGIMYQKTVDGKSGQYDVYVDGEFKTTLDANFKGGWGPYVESTEVYRSDSKAKHTVEIKKHADSTGNVFSICSLLIS